MEFIKKQGLTFILNAVACVCALLAVIFFLVTNGMVSVGNGVLAIAMGFVGVAAVAAGAFASIKFGAQSYITAAVKFVAVIALMILFGVLVADRSAMAANLFTWDHGNTDAWAAFYVSIVAGVFELVAVVLQVVTSFMEGKKQEA